jgi:DNA-binding HxlR family transcriptional regulator
MFVIKKEIPFEEKIKAIQDTMFVLGGKWKLPVILAIYSGKKRFNDIGGSIPGITNRVLSKELRHLEENLLIIRSVIDDYPVRIEYTLTDYCLTTEKVAAPMEEWGKNHRKKIGENHKKDQPR